MDVLSKQQQKYIQSLHNKKYRKQFGSFLVEGKKSIEELLMSDYELEMLVLAKEITFELENPKYPIFRCAAADLIKISSFQANNYGLAVVKCKESPLPNNNEWHLVLDGIKDPGNLGTIIRLADWYGIKHVVCSEDCVDVYNPKTIASTMGSFLRINTAYTSLKNYLSNKECLIVGAILDGQNVHQFNFPNEGIMVIGSESHGISEEIMPFISKKISIPAFGKAESLNAAMATGILLDNLRRTN